jgi:hypothetical protein
LDDCRGGCSANKKCKYYYYNKETNECMLMKEVGTNTSNASYTSAAKVEPVTATGVAMGGPAENGDSQEESGTVEDEEDECDSCTSCVLTRGETATCETSSDVNTEASCVEMSGRWCRPTPVQWCNYTTETPEVEAAPEVCEAGLESMTLEDCKDLCAACAMCTTILVPDGGAEGKCVMKNLRSIDLGFYRDNFQEDQKLYVNDRNEHCKAVFAPRSPSTIDTEVAAAAGDEADKKDLNVFEQVIEDYGVALIIVPVTAAGTFVFAAGIRAWYSSRPRPSEQEEA